MGTGKWVELCGDLPNRAARKGEQAVIEFDVKHGSR